MSDIALVNDTGFKFTVRLKDGDLEFDEGLETAVSISLFSDKRIPEEELPPAETDRRGWWGDMFPDVDQDEIGSKLWLLARSKRTLETLRRTEDYAREALQWLIEDGVASNVTVVAEFSGDVSEGRWALGVVITRPTGQDFKYKVLWDQQEIKRG